MSRKKFTAVIISFLLIFISACNSQKGSTPSGVALVPVEFASLGSLATISSNPQSFDVDQGAKLIELGNGMSLQVPTGAFSSPTQLVLSQVDVAFDKISFVAKQSSFYALSPRDEVGALGSPLILEITIPTGYVTVLRYDGQNWQAIKGTPGQTVQIEIAHFSSWIWGYLEQRSEQDLKERLADNPQLNVMPTLQREHIEKGDELTRAFFGVGESSIESQEQMCSDLVAVLKLYNKPENRKFPSDSGLLNLDLGPFLFDGSAPKDSGGYFYDVTKKSLDIINNEVLASTTPLSPADVLKIAIEANGGNIPLGVLAAHNYLKDIKYLGLADFKYGKPFPEKQGLPASHLASWREGSNITPSGEYDKMGPIYHIFAAMTAGVWFPTRMGADIAAEGEAMLRTFELLSDHPDTQKGSADACGQDSSLWLRANPAAEEQAESPTEEPTPDSVINGSGNWHGVECDEAEGTFIYRWSVSLMQDPNTGELKGTVKFHNCPGGGRVLYSVVGSSPTGSVYTLTGEKRDGGGTLFDSSADNLIFTFDSTSATIEPNLAP
jgi:hypothetical protein